MKDYKDYMDRLTLDGAARERTLDAMRKAAAGRSVKADTEAALPAQNIVALNTAPAARPRGAWLAKAASMAAAFVILGATAGTVYYFSTRPAAPQPPGTSPTVKDDPLSPSPPDVSPSGVMPLSPSPSPSDDAVTFTNAYFEEKVRAAINKPEGVITQSDLAAVTSLSLDPAPPNNELEPLRYMPNLRYLHLGGTGEYFGGSELLQGLTKLEELSVDNRLSLDECFKLMEILPDCAVYFYYREQDPPADTVTDENGLTWRVAPQYDYPDLYLCDCGTYRYRHTLGAGSLYGYIDIIVSPYAGEITHSGLDVHGSYGVAQWLYDPAAGRYMLVVASESGYELTEYAAGEFDSLFPRYSQRFRAVRRADFSKIDMSLEYPNYYDSYTDELYALAYGNKLITDYIYSESDIDQNIMRSYSGAGRYPQLSDEPPVYAAVVRDGKWILLDTAGNRLLPQEFDHILGISGTTLFAKVNGLYGILELG
ncbi:MAG: hypothetical protein LBI44_03975 [Oscillospiraceae bacterium]|jgi:hypothetical protein|nr:hypothetical protein [Oscillospiraceae bacterium]